jgi:hypothetical protein
LLKELIKFSKFRYGRVVMVPYWVGQYPSQGMFSKKTLSKSCSEYEVDGGNTFGNGVLDISMDHIVSFMGAFVEGVFRPSFAMQPFSKPFYFPLIYYGINIECYVQWKLKCTAIPLEVRNTLNSMCTRN